MNLTFFNIRFLLFTSFLLWRWINFMTDILRRKCIYGPPVKMIFFLPRQTLGLKWPKFTGGEHPHLLKLALWMLFLAQAQSHPGCITHPLSLSLSAKNKIRQNWKGTKKYLHLKDKRSKLLFVFPIQLKVKQRNKNIFIHQWHSMSTLIL